MADRSTAPEESSPRAEIGPPEVEAGPGRARWLGPLEGAWRRWERALWREVPEEAGSARGLARRWTQVFALAGRDFGRHGCLLRASALTYTTFLSLVPILAVAVAILTALGYQRELADRILEYIARGAEAVREEDPVRQGVEKIVEFVDGIRAGSLGGLGGAALVLVAISLLATVEQSMNAIWEVERGRPWLRKGADYLSLVLVAPILLGLGASLTTLARLPGEDGLAAAASQALNSPLLRSVFGVFPFLAVWVVFIFIYNFIPNTRVQWRSAVLAGLIGGTLWQLAQAAYIGFTVELLADRYHRMYGAFAWLAILVVWVFVSWSILLFGAEVAHAHQTRQHHVRARRPWGGTPAEWETLALRLGALLARPMRAPAEGPFSPVTVESAADLMAVPSKPTARMLELFRRAGLAARTEEPRGYVLCRSPEEVPLLDVLRLAREGEWRGEGEAPGGALAPMGEAIRRVMQDRRLGDLVDLPIQEVRTFPLAATPDPVAGAAPAGPIVEVRPNVS